MATGKSKRKRNQDVDVELPGGALVGAGTWLRFRSGQQTRQRSSEGTTRWARGVAETGAGASDSRGRRPSDSAQDGAREILGTQARVGTILRQNQPTTPPHAPEKPIHAQPRPLRRAAATPTVARVTVREGRDSRARGGNQRRSPRPRNPSPQSWDLEARRLAPRPGQVCGTRTDARPPRPRPREPGVMAESRGSDRGWATWFPGPPGRPSGARGGADGRCRHRSRALLKPRALAGSPLSRAGPTELRGALRDAGGAVAALGWAPPRPR
nr:uncharacterized protein LOC116158349 [Camelus dromedarius]